MRVDSSISVRLSAKSPRLGFAEWGSKPIAVRHVTLSRSSIALRLLEGFPVAPWPARDRSRSNLLQFLETAVPHPLAPI